MKLNQLFSVVLVFAAAGAAGAQTAPTPATTNSTPTTTAGKPTTTTSKSATATAAKPATTAAKPATTTAHTAAAASTALKLPPGVPVVKGIVKPAAFALRYEDITIGTGPDAVPIKMYKVNYTGYLGANGRPDDGHKFDSSFDPHPVIGKDGKPVLGDDGKPKLGDPHPMVFPQGIGRLIPGFDQGFAGMKVGGKRRLFIPWQLAYGAAGNPAAGILPKSDLIFDVELVDMADLPAPAKPPVPPTPAAPARPSGSVPPPPGSGAPAAPAQPAATTAPATPATPAAPATPSQPAAPASPPQPQAK